MSTGGYPLDSKFLATLREESRFNSEVPAVPAAFSAVLSSRTEEASAQPVPELVLAPANGGETPRLLHRSRGGSTSGYKGPLEQGPRQPPPIAPPIASRRADLPVRRSQPPQSVLFERLAAQRVSSLPPADPLEAMMSGEESKLLPRGLGSSQAGSRPYDNGYAGVLGATERRLSNASTFSVRDSQMQFGRDTILGPKRPRPHKIWRKKYIKVLVVGDSGLGKTTLIKSLMSTPGDRLQVHDGTYTPTDQFKKDPASLCSTISWRDEEDRVIWVYKIQDTPGYGDDLNVQNNIDMMLQYIQRQNDKWLEMEQSKDRKEDLAELEDTRVDICLFCLPPHRMRPIDLKYMYELGLHVPIVPVVTKADTMTIREAATYRNEVANKIANPMLPGIRDKINVFKFERDTLERAGVLDHGVPTPPFLVVASNDINEDMNQAEPPTFWPERRYPWGTAEAFNREHSDLLSLRALLLKEALEEINKTKRQRYEGWRRAALSSVKWGRNIRHMLMWTIIPAVLCLQVGRQRLSMADLKKKIRGHVKIATEFVNKKTGGHASRLKTALKPPQLHLKASSSGPPAPEVVVAPAPKKKLGFF